MTALTSKSNITFADLGVRDEIVRALLESGKEHPFAIQELTLPLALAGEDLIGQARTGMGKTLAFGVPLLHRVSTDQNRPLTGARAPDRRPDPRAVSAVFDDLTTAAKYVPGPDGRKLKVTAIYGGRPLRTADRGASEGRRRRRRHPPGPAAGSGPAGPSAARRAVGAGARRGRRDARPGLPARYRAHPAAHPPDTRQAMLFSATMPDPIITLARTFMNQPTHIRAEAPQSSQTHDTTEQFAYRAHALDKVEMVARILQAEGRGATMIFTRTKRTAQKVADELGERGFKVGAVHGDLGQIAREKALKGFRNGDVDVLVATDVAARGIDIDDITHVINFQIPPRTSRPTCTASVAPAAPARPVSPSPWSIGTNCPPGGR